MSSLDSVAAHQQLITALIVHLASRHPGQTPRLVQTHISSVLLVGPDAYKLKRPVRYAFVDFSTLEKRQFYCREELRINRRSAPEIYLDVVPVTGSIETPQLGGTGKVIEWALHMRRFPDEALLSAQAHAGRLQARQIDELATYLAAFHLGLPTLSPADLAGFASMSARVDDNLAELAPMLVAKSLDASKFVPFSAAIRQWAGRCDATIPARQKDGFFRECHGDLHLANLVEINGKVCAFDALEFDPALRCIDVINDLAFVFMDLLAFGQTNFAWRLVSGYLEYTGDYEGLSMLDGYAANRALIRAKVMLLADSQACDAKRYLDLAMRLVEVRQAPVLVLVGGVSGSGKSTFSSMLAPRLGAIRIRSDVERKRLYKNRTIPADQALYSTIATQRTYARLLQVAECGLRAGVSIVIDATFTEPVYAAPFVDMARRQRCRLEIVECLATESLMRDRILARMRTRKDPSDATPEIMASQLAHKAAVEKRLPGLKIRAVHNTGTLNELEKQAQALARALLINT